jgi:hypothetical protein
MTEARDFETGLSPERLQQLSDEGYARAHASPFCGVECPPKHPDDIRIKQPPIYVANPSIQARAAAGRWTGSRSPFGCN